MNVKKNNWFKEYYNNLLKFADIFKKSNNEKKIKIIMDLLLLIVITCMLKIPFIFIRNIGDKIIDMIFNNNINILVIWGLVIELVYVIVGIAFFIKTIKKWINNLEK